MSRLLCAKRFKFGYTETLYAHWQVLRGWAAGGVRQQFDHAVAWDIMTRNTKFLNIPVRYSELGRRSFSIESSSFQSQSESPFNTTSSRLILSNHCMFTSRLHQSCSIEWKPQALQIYLDKQNLQVAVLSLLSLERHLPRKNHLSPNLECPASLHIPFIQL